MGLFRRSTESQNDADTMPIAPTTSAAVSSAATPGIAVAGSAFSADRNFGDGAAANSTAGAAPTEAELQELRETVSEIHRVLSEFADRGSAQEKVFDTLHSELQDYKNDFIYEHLKPVLWPLLFLFDSLEQYAREIVGRATSTGGHQVDAKEVLDHLKFFRGQLVESLRICEVTPMKQPSGFIDPKCHKGIGVEPVQNPADDNTIRRVVRTGWFLNGKVLRHAEVIVGKHTEVVKTMNSGAAAAKSAMPLPGSAASGPATAT